MKNTMVMLFHTNEAAKSFIVRLKGRDFGDKDIILLGRDDLPQFGRGEHAAAGGGIMERIGSFFSGGTEEPERRYSSLADYLEGRGLSRGEADHYENEVGKGNYMVAVRAGDRDQVVEELAHGDTTDPGTRYEAPRSGAAATGSVADQDIAGAGVADRTDKGDTAERGGMELRKEELTSGKEPVGGAAEVSERTTAEGQAVDVPIIPDKECESFETRVTPTEEVTPVKSDMGEAPSVSGEASRDEQEQDVNRTADQPTTDEERRLRDDDQGRRQAA